MVIRCLTAALVGLLALGAAPAARIPSAADASIHQISAGELRAHVAFLASDTLAGRGVGHAGNAAAEQYIAGALRSAGVQPAAPGYLQTVEVYQPRLGDGSRLLITSDEQAPLADLTLGADFYPLPASGDRPVSGRVVLGGHGLSAPALRHDDYATLDARGAIVLVLDDLPKTVADQPSLSSDERTELGSIDRKLADARAHGAAGLLVVRAFMSDPRAVWPETTSVQSASYRLRGPMQAAPVAVAALSERAAAPIRQALEQRRIVRAQLIPGVTAAPVAMHNVIGMIDGHHTTGELVVVGAHLDHDGTDAAGAIYNGADDNASGTAAVIGIAAAFARAAARGERPKRAVVFALWNGEEKGSLGAEFYVSTPAPAGRVVAVLNLDMIGRREEIPDPDDPRFRGFARRSAAASANVVHLLGYSRTPDLAATVTRANEGVGLTLQQEYDRGAQGLLRRSDHWPFLLHGVPAVFLTTGLHPDYHTPDDDTDRLDFGKLERIAELAGRAAWMAADGDRPRMLPR